ncbi:MAG: class I SAM-dependent methyltransferase [Acidimicrobiia bacterium]
MEVAAGPTVPPPDLRWRTDKYAELSDWILARGVTSVLDVGCRDGVLRRSLEERAAGRPVPTYHGVDLAPQETYRISVVADLAAGLPVADGAVDLAVALDVVEHLDDFQGGLEELFRASRRYVAVTLPNLAHGIVRAKFLFKGRIGGKYDLTYGYGKDRHRWMTVLDQTDRYLEAFARETGSRLSCVRLPLSGPRSMPFERALSALRFDPAWYVWVTLYLLEKPATAGARAKAGSLSASSALTTT